MSSYARSNHDGRVSSAVSGVIGQGDGPAGPYHRGVWPVHSQTGDPIIPIDGQLYVFHAGGVPGQDLPVTCHTLRCGRLLFYRTRFRDQDSLLGWASCPNWLIVEVLRVAGVVVFGTRSTFEWEALRQIEDGTSQHGDIVANAGRPRLAELGIDVEVGR